MLALVNEIGLRNHTVPAFGEQDYALIFNRRLKINLSFDMCRIFIG